MNILPWRCAREAGIVMNDRLQPRSLWAGLICGPLNLIWFKMNAAARSENRAAVEIKSSCR